MVIKVLKKWPGLPERQAMVNDHNELFLDISNETDREYTSLQFYFGKYTVFIKFVAFYSSVLAFHFK